MLHDPSPIGTKSPHLVKLQRNVTPSDATGYFGSSAPDEVSGDWELCPKEMCDLEWWPGTGSNKITKAQQCRLG